MRRIAGVLALVGAIGSGTPAAAEEPARRIVPYDSRVEVLDNGLKTILIPLGSEGLVSFWTVVRTGSRDEYEPGRTGFAHFFEHMMFRGTEKYPADVYKDLLTRMGADANAYTTDDLTAYHMGLGVEDLPRAIELEGDRFQNLAYTRADFQTEAGAVYGEYRKNRTNPSFQLYEALVGTAYERHTYGHTTMGYERDIEKMPEMYDYSRSFFERYYRPENVVLLIVGDIDAAATLALVREHYGAWKPGYVPPRVDAEPAQTAERRVHVDYEGQTLPILWLSYKAGRFDPDDRLHVALELLAQLAFGETSEIHRKLVLEDQTVESIQAELNRNRDPGRLDISARVKNPQDVEAVRVEIDRTLANCRQRLPDARRLADLKSRLKYRFLMSLDTPDGVASNLARIVAITGGIEAVDRLYAMYDTISPEDVRAAAEHYLLDERRTVGTLGGSKK